MVSAQDIQSRDLELKSCSDHLLDLFKLVVVQLLGTALSWCIANCSPSCQLGFLCRVDLRCVFDSLCPEKPRPQGICQLSYIFITTRHQHLKPYTYANWPVILSYIHADGTKRRKVGPSISRLHLKRKTAAILQIWTLLYIYILLKVWYWKIPSIDANRWPVFVSSKSVKVAISNDILEDIQVIEPQIRTSDPKLYEVSTNKRVATSYSLSKCVYV